MMSPIVKSAIASQQPLSPMFRATMMPRSLKTLNFMIQNRHLWTQIAHGDILIILVRLLQYHWYCTCIHQREAPWNHGQSLPTQWPSGQSSAGTVVWSEILLLEILSVPWCVGGSEMKGPSLGLLPPKIYMWGISGDSVSFLLIDN